jgi:thiol-disulfide isomerase/thioredoxin
MKKLLLALFLISPLLAAAQQQKPDVYIFTSPTCVHCMKFKREHYPDLKNKYSGKVNFIELDASVAENSLKLTDMAQKYGKDPAVPALAAGEYFLLGYPNQIGLYSAEAIDHMLANNKETKELGEANPAEAFKTFTLAAIIINGLVDGINPCAFAVIVFFVSFLSVYGYNKREVIYVGTAYCLAVFITYILLGLGLFNVLYALEGFQLAIRVFYILTAAVCFIFFFLSVYDFIMYIKTKDGKAMLLRLPDNLKVRINKIIGFFLRDKEKSTPRLIIASLAVGFAVSLVEAVCTGQVYVPTIVLIMKEPAFRLRAFLYILIYNLLFIFPLLVTFALTVAGQKSQTLNNFFRKNLGLTKVLLSLVFLGLGIMILLS